MKKIFIKTLGCKVNQCESEAIAAVRWWNRTGLGHR